MYVYLIIFVLLRQKKIILIKQVENSTFTFSFYHPSWTRRIVKVLESSAIP